jgi:hypothetical protein
MKNSGKRVREITIRAVVYQQGESLCAQCLEWDIATQAKTLEALCHDLDRLIVGHIAIGLEHGFDALAAVRRAPQKYWEMFRRSRIELPPHALRFKPKRRGVTVRPPQIRIVAAA